MVKRSMVGTGRNTYAAWAMLVAMLTMFGCSRAARSQPQGVQTTSWQTLESLASASTGDQQQAIHFTIDRTPARILFTVPNASKDDPSSRSIVSGEITQVGVPSGKLFNVLAAPHGTGVVTIDSPGRYSMAVDSTSLWQAVVQEGNKP